MKFIRRWRFQMCLNIAMIAIVLFSAASATNAENWARFRGPNGSGISSSTGIPSQWSLDENVQWTVDLPGPGSSSPIVYGDHVFLTCYTGYGVDSKDPGEVSDLKRHLMCFDRTNGELVWQATIDSLVDEDSYQGFITEHGYASSTPVTDGEHIYVAAGKSGVYAFDMKGEKVWQVSVGEQSDPFHWGTGASPILYQNLVIVNASNMGRAIVALDKATGKEVWKYADEEFKNCWSTPIIVHAGDRDECVLSVPGRILALDPASGEERWSADSPIKRTTCGSVVADGQVVYAMGGRAGDAIAVRCGGEGDVTESHTEWTARLRSGIGTPVVASDRLYWTVSGTAFCADCKTGEYIYRERIESSAPQSDDKSDGDDGDDSDGGDDDAKGDVQDEDKVAAKEGATDGDSAKGDGDKDKTKGSERANGANGARGARGDSRRKGRRSPTGDYASAVIVGGNVLLVTRSGMTHVVKDEVEFTKIAANHFVGDPGPFNATPAVSDGQLFIRSDKRLYCIADSN